MIVHFVDIGGIDDRLNCVDNGGIDHHRCMHFLFIIWMTKRKSKTRQTMADNFIRKCHIHCLPIKSLILLGV
jgi:hypothetical protein